MGDPFVARIPDIGEISLRQGFFSSFNRGNADEACGFAHAVAAEKVGKLGKILVARDLKCFADRYTGRTYLAASARVTNRARAPERPIHVDAPRVDDLKAPVGCCDHRRITLPYIKEGDVELAARSSCPGVPTNNYSGEC